jgi:hypothetical protein
VETGKKIDFPWEQRLERRSHSIFDFGRESKRGSLDFDFCLLWLRLDFFREDYIENWCYSGHQLAL